MGHAVEAAKVNRYLTAFNDRVLNDPNLKLYDPKIGLWDPGAFARMGSDNLTLLGDLQPRKTNAELIQSIAEEMKGLGYMTIGVKSVYNLLSTVTQGGYADIAAAVLQRQEYPSLLYSIAQTGGTVGEGWNQQHSYAQIEGLASVGRWFYCDLVGIKPSSAKPAFGQFELRPHVPVDVKKFDFTYDSPRGLIESHWNADGERVVWSVTIPPNAVAEVSIPGQAVQGVNEEGVRLVRSEKDRQVFQVDSGNYTFQFIKSLPDR
jgi:alpha-L-rhamnosidase